VAIEDGSRLAKDQAYKIDSTRCYSLFIVKANGLQEKDSEFELLLTW